MRVFLTGGSGFLGQRLIRALCERGYEVRALARSDRAARIVEDAGATSARGDLEDKKALRDGMKGCEMVIHAAALLDFWGKYEDFHRVNVIGTENVINASMEAGARRFVEVGAAIVALGGRSAVGIDESWPKPECPPGDYARTKSIAEDLVLKANSSILETVVVRPPAIWGKGDKMLLPSLVDGVKKGFFVWINGGRYPYVTCHVANVCEGIMLAAERGAPGEVYFLTDGEPMEFRKFITGLLSTQGLKPSGRSVPLWSVKPVAAVVELVWRVLGIKSRPPISPMMLKLVGEPLVISDAKARREIGYTSAMTFEKGLAEIEPLA